MITIENKSFNSTYERYFPTLALLSLLQQHEECPCSDMWDHIRKLAKAAEQEQHQHLLWTLNGQGSEEMHPPPSNV